MKQKTKRENSAAIVRQMESSFRCPICHTPVHIEGETMRCANRHSFDFAKQGYLNVTTRPIKTHYDKQLFESRRELMHATDFFTPVRDALTGILKPFLNERSEPILLDTGTGEGTHLSMLSQSVPHAHAIGIDLAKEGIMVAAKHDPAITWIVADIGNIPLADASTDMILTILAPSNYEEFSRLLKKDGLLVKVVPNERYLHELRTLLYEGTDKATYSNEATTERFEDRFQLVDKVDVTYTITLTPASLQALIDMTPLTWNISDDKRTQLINTMTSITVDITILVGKPHAR